MAGPIDKTEAGDQHVMPGFEQDDARSDAARAADHKREMEARQKQSKMRSTVQQQDAGPLFDGQDSLF